jgi:hypothetical protein
MTIALLTPPIVIGGGSESKGHLVPARVQHGPSAQRFGLQDTQRFQQRV